MGGEAKLKDPEIRAKKRQQYLESKTPRDGGAGFAERARAQRAYIHNMLRRGR